MAGWCPLGMYPVAADLLPGPVLLRPCMLVSVECKLSPFGFNFKFHFDDILGYLAYQKLLKVTGNAEKLWLVHSVI